MVIDGNSILNRAFYGLQGANLLATSDGLYTNAVFGFINIMNKFIEEENPQYLCVAFDLKAPTFRHKQFDGYKANRKGMPEELRVQVPVIKDVLDAMRIKRLEMEGFEADDILGSISLCATQRDMEVVIVTGDRDALQLAGKATRIKIPKTKGGKTETEEYDFDIIREKYNIDPVQFIDVKALMGDTSDNIPGVPGVGEKTALDLIHTYSSLENLYDNLDQITKKGLKDKLVTYKEQAFMSKKLAAIERNMPFLCHIDELLRGEFDKTRLYELFRHLEFKSFIDKFGLKDSQPFKESLSINTEVINDKQGVKNLKNKIQELKELSLYYLIDKVDKFTNRLSGISISVEAGNAYYLGFNDVLSEDAFLEEFKSIFEDGEIKKYSHDLKNFIVYLKHKGIELNGISFDTMIGAYIINPSRETYTISELASDFLNLDIKPIEEMSGKGRSFVSYAGMDEKELKNVVSLYPEVIFMSMQKIADKLKENDQANLYYDIELPLVRVLADMEFYGFKININELIAISRQLDEKILKLTLKIYELAGEEFNINSPKQLGVVLFEKLELPIIKKTKTGYSTDAEVLEELTEKHEIVSNILEYRQLVKLKSTYIDGLMAVINPVTGKIHSSFNQTVTVTGRISSTEPNLQNIPIKLDMGRNIRRAFVPCNDNYKLVDADYSQIELRVLAHITDDENMIHAFINNEDIHTSTASKVFGVPLEEVTSALRSKAKAVNFGIVYGIGDFSLSKDLGITRKEARTYIDGYLDKFANVRKYMHDIVAQGKEFGFVTTMFSRRRYLPELKASNFNVRSFGERIAMNTPIQGSAADIIKIAMVMVHSELNSRKLKSRLILQVHDELIIETHESEVEEVTMILKESMENAAKLKVPLSVEVKSGNSWYETK
jgi:DNA polymerase-1